MPGVNVKNAKNMQKSWKKKNFRWHNVLVRFRFGEGNLYGEERSI